MEKQVAGTSISHEIAVLDSTLHYVEEGEGDPIVFIHGMPTSSYLWRGVMPIVSKQARCIAVDLIGMGESGKPDIQYSIHDHINYIDAFLDKMQLRNMTLVMHGWGSIIGFNYAMRHQDRIKGLAFLEAHVAPPAKWEDLSLPVEHIAHILQDEEALYDKIVQENYLIERFLVDASLHDFTDEEMEVYRKPFSLPEHREVLMQYAREWPLGKGTSPAETVIEQYSRYLEHSLVPKLMLFAIPGFITTIEVLQWCKNNLHNLTMVDLGDALHFAQEAQPTIFANALLDWYHNI